MLHRLTFAPFPDADAEIWFADLGDALEADGATGLLLANLAVSEALTLTAVAVLPGRVIILQPASKSPVNATALQQQTALAVWLGTWPELPPVPAAAILGFTIGPTATIANHAAAWPTTPLEALPRQLQELPNTLPLPTTVLEAWTVSLTDEEEDAEPHPTAFWEQKARQLWNWLGAADVPIDPPYGAVPAPSALPADTAAEQQRLEQLRQQVFAELQQQRQQMEAREAAREQSISQLQQQLAAAPSAAAEVAALQARLAAETQEKNALAAAIAASRQETDIRNRELEARMQQLGQQVEQLRTRPTAAPTPAGAVPSAPPAPGSAPAASPAQASQPARQRAGQTPAAGRRAVASASSQWRLQWPRVTLVLGLLAGIGAGGWAVQHYARPPAGQAQGRRPASEDRDDDFDENLEAAAPTLLDIQPDTIQVDSEKSDSDKDIVPETAAPAPGEVMDSVVAPADGI